MTTTNKVTVKLTKLRPTTQKKQRQTQRMTQRRTQRRTQKQKNKRKYREIGNRANGNEHKEKYKGAGLIILSYDNEPQVLLIQGTNYYGQNGKWGFPKGHRDEGENDSKITAMREVQEEIGLLPENYKIHEQRFVIESYAFRYATIKEEFKNKPAIADPEEIKNVKWVSFSCLSFYLKKGNMKFKKWVENINKNPVQKAQIIELSMNFKKSN